MLREPYLHGDVEREGILFLREAFGDANHGMDCFVRAGVRVDEAAMKWFEPRNINGKVWGYMRRATSARGVQSKAVVFVEIAWCFRSRPLCTRRSSTDASCKRFSNKGAIAARLVEGSKIN